MLNNNTSAYLLVYVKKNVIEDVLCDLSAEDIPAHLKERFENERQYDLQNEKYEVLQVFFYYINVFHIILG